MPLTQSEASIPACFFFASSVDRDVTGYQVCKECELVTGSGGIVGAQKLFGLWRIYPSSEKARNTLLIKGVTIGQVFVPIVGTNPKIVQGEHESPTVKLIIGNIGLSVSGDEILKELEKVEGVVIRSKMFEEGYRDENGKLTLFKSGRRFVYVTAT